MNLPSTGRKMFWHARSAMNWTILDGVLFSDKMIERTEHTNE